MVFGLLIPRGSFISSWATKPESLGNPEKQTLEIGLERPCPGEPDLKARADLVLAGAKNFYLRAADFVQFGAHRTGRERRRIAIPAQMSENDAGNFAG